MRRGGRKIGLGAQERAQVIAALRDAREAMTTVHTAYRTQSVTYQAASTVRENCEALAAILSDDPRIFETPLHSTPGPPKRD